MQSLPSSLTSQEQEFVIVKNGLSEHGFALGGNWDYDHGSFDCALDDENKVWLRLPFDVTNGNLDSESPEIDAKIRFGEPYVLKHLYNEGIDKGAMPGVMSAAFNQFSDPVDPDASIESRWIERAKTKLRKVEAIYPA
ncbi:YugN family protein [Cohnella sp. GCM10027633]|uniref:YugN family protein n=1 Tax=unclassified Cohnella TaxID=2636738 RepID=UPI00362F8605